MPDLFKYAQSTTYPVRLLGKLSHLPSPSPAQSPDPRTSTLTMIDRAQVKMDTCVITGDFLFVVQKQGLLPWVTSDSDQCLFSISKYGVKVTDSKRQRVYSRHPLHHIVTITHYLDTYHKHMLVVRVTGQTEQQQEQLFIYQAEDEVILNDIIQ